MACLLHTSKPSFVFVNVHKQVGHNDCGVFSVAYAVALCLDQPGEFVFDQSLMRHHSDVTKTRNGMINGTIHGMKVSSLVDLLRIATHEGRLL